MKFKILEFRKLTTSDVFDDYYNDGSAWSRIYEYPAVINRIKNLVPNYLSASIHNSSWGFEGVHIKFKNELDKLSSNCLHSDIKPSPLPKTTIYNITNPASKKMQNFFDAVVNISTLEEVGGDHIDILINLTSQIKSGGHFIGTFDLPGLQLDKFEKLFRKELAVEGIPINGENSHLPNAICKDLNVGIMVLQVYTD
jgi:hypothetical protein